MRLREKVRLIRDTESVTALLLLFALLCGLFRFASLYCHQSQPSNLASQLFAFFLGLIPLLCLIKFFVEGSLDRAGESALFVGLIVLFFVIRFPTDNYPFWLGDFGDYSTSAFKLANTGEIPTDWYHGTVLWLNAGIQIFGRDWAHLISLVFGLISAIYISRCAYLVSGHSKTAFLASFAVIACTLPHSWYSQLPAAEIFAQAVFFAGVYYLLRSCAYPDSLIFPIVSAISFASYFLTRPMGLLIYHLLWIYVLLSSALHDEGIRRWQALFLISLTIGFTGWSIYTFRFNDGYLDYQLAAQFPRSGVDSGRVILGSAIATTAYMILGLALNFRLKFLAKSSTWAAGQLSRPMVRGGVFLFGFSLLYAYTGASSTLAEKLLRISSFVAYFGGGVFVYGLYRWLRFKRAGWHQTHLLLFVPTLFAFYLNRYPLGDSLHYLYWDRYFFEICFGYFVVIMVFGLATLKRPIALVVVLLICVYGIYDSRLILGKAELQGAFNSLISLDRLLPERASVVVGKQATLTDADWIATSDEHAYTTLPTALGRICNKNVLTANWTDLTNRKDVTKVWEFLKERDSVYYIFIGKEPPNLQCLPEQLTVRKIGWMEFRYRHFYSIRMSPARGFEREFDIPLHVFLVEKSGEGGDSPDGSGSLLGFDHERVSIHSEAPCLRWSGFHEDGIWTNGEGEISGFYRKLTSESFLVLEAQGWNPNRFELNTLNLSVAVAGRNLPFDHRDGLKYFFTLPSDLSVINEIRIRSSTFVPKDLGINDDVRSLGFDFKAITFE